MKRTLKALTRVLTAILILFAATGIAGAQTYPVLVNTQVSPPYSPFLSDYTAPGVQRLLVNFVLRDPTLPEYACKLRLTIEGVGITIRTKPGFAPRPLVLPGGGIPLQLYGEDLAEYFLPANLDFSGITRSQYEKGAKLPEGVYRFTIEVLDYNRGAVVSNKGTAMAWIILNDPPLLNMPRNDTKVTIIDPANIAFNWTPRHTASPNSAFTAEYIFRLVEIWPLTRNPYDAMLSQQPLYEVTTDFTQLVYTMAEPALIPGRKYAWQVQAKDTEGRDLFKNQGKSEVYVFQYGDALGAPEGLYLQTANPTSLVVRWEQNVAGTDAVKYRVRYRPHKNRTQEAWYEDQTEDQWRTLTSLQPATEYEVQVRAEQSVQVSEYSAIQVFKTAEQGANEFVCKSDVAPPPAPNGSGPTFRLGVNDTIHAGGYEVLVRELTANANGIYTGTGMAIVPWFNSAKVKVTFKNIGVNEQHWLTSGEIKSVWNADSKFLLKPEPKPNTPGNTPNSGPVPVTEAETKTLIEITGAAIATVTKNEDGDIEIATTDGETKVLEKGQSYSIVDEVGNGYVVDKDGNITKTTAEVARGAAERGDRNYTIALRFEKGDGKLGFDAKKYDALAQYYQQLEGSGEYIAWKAVTAKSDPVTAVLEGTGIDPKKVRFQVGGVPLSVAPNGNTYRIDVLGKAEGTVEELLALYKPADTAKDNVLGKLNLVSYDQVQHNLVIVPVNNIQLPGGPSAPAVAAELSRIYGQAVAHWNVRIDPSLTVSLGNEFDDGESGLLTNYTGDMKKVINAYGSLVDKTYYLFLVNNPKSSPTALGYMPRNKQAGFIFVDNHAKNNANIIQTMAHELGHGAFHLQHTFDEIPGLIKGSTDNVMDYPAGTQLYKYQWDHVHSPQAVLGLFEDDSEGELMAPMNYEESADEQPPAELAIAWFYYSNETRFVKIKFLKPASIKGNMVTVGNKEYALIYSKAGRSFLGFYLQTALDVVDHEKNDDGTITYKGIPQKITRLVAGQDYEVLEEGDLNAQTPKWIETLKQRKDLTKAQLDAIVSLVNRVTDQAFTEYLNLTVDNNARCGTVDVGDLAVQYPPECWEAVIAQLERLVNDSLDKWKGIFALLDNTKITDEDKASIKLQLRDLNPLEYGMLTAGQRLKLLSYFVSKNMYGNYFWTENEESFAFKVLKYADTNQADDIIKGLESVPVKLNDPEIKPEYTGSLMKNLDLKVNDGIWGVGKNLQKVTASVVRLLAKSKTALSSRLGVVTPEVGFVQNSYFMANDGDKMLQIYYMSDGGKEVSISQGRWSIKKKCEWVSGYGDDMGREECVTIENRVVWDPTIRLDPFDLVLIAEESDFSLIEGIDPLRVQQGERKMLLIPAFAAFYAHESGELKNIETYVGNTLDVVTLLVPITKIATAPVWLNRFFKFVDVFTKVNAAANLTVRNSALKDSPEVKEWMDAYNAVTLGLNGASLLTGIGRAVVVRYIVATENKVARQALLEAAAAGDANAQAALDAAEEFKRYGASKTGDENWWKAGQVVTAVTSKLTAFLEKFPGVSAGTRIFRNSTKNKWIADVLANENRIVVNVEEVATDAVTAIEKIDDVRITYRGKSADLMEETGSVAIGMKNGEYCVIGNYLCFAGNTPIRTAFGDVPADQITEHMQLASWDASTEKKIFSPVRQVVKSVTTKLTRIVFAGTLLLSTPNHPVYANGLWQNAADLKAGDTLSTYDDRFEIVERVETFDTLAAVYNFELERNNTYFAGARPVLVNTTCLLNVVGKDRFNDLMNWCITKGIPSPGRGKFYNALAARLQQLSPGFVDEFLGVAGKSKGAFYGTTAFQNKIYDFIVNGTTESASFWDDLIKSTDPRWKQLLSQNAKGVDAWEMMATMPLIRVKANLLEQAIGLLNNGKLQQLGVTKEVIKNIVKANQAVGASRRALAASEVMENIDVLSRIDKATISNLPALLAELQKDYGMFTVGAQWTLRDIRKNLLSALNESGATLTFEFRVGRKEVDLLFESANGSRIFMEFKSGPRAVTKSTIINQFVKRDMLNATTPSEILWRIEPVGGVTQASMDDLAKAALTSTEGLDALNTLRLSNPAMTTKLEEWFRLRTGAQITAADVEAYLVRNSHYHFNVTNP